MSTTGSSKKIPAKFGDTCSVRADGLCIGCLGQWAERGRQNSNMQEFFCTTLYKGLVGNRHISINRLMVTFAIVVHSEVDVVDLSQRMLIWWEVVHG